MADIGGYLLDNEGNPYKEPDTMKWAEGFEKMKKDRIVKQTTVKGHFVSTIFLGLDNSFGGHIPMLFETMIWFEDEDIYQDRHSTRQKAELAHDRLVNQITYGQELR